MIKIKGRYIIGYDADDHIIINNGEVVYENDTIIYVGSNYEGDVDEVIDAGNSVVSPGFIDLNALGDIDHDLIHVEIPKEKVKNLGWSEDYYENHRYEPFTAEEEAFKSLYAYTQLLLHGVTTGMTITSVLYKKYGETYEELEAAVHHAGKLGMRMYLGPSYLSGKQVVKNNGEVYIRMDEEEGRLGLKRAVKFVGNYDNAYDGLIKGMLAPERIEYQTEENLINTKKAANELGCLIKLHAAQGQFEYEHIYQKTGMSPIAYLNSIDFLGKNVGIPHSYFVTSYSESSRGEGDDLALLEETGTTVIHCPIIIGRHCSALESFASYKRREINLSIGTDTFPPCFFQNIRTASMLSRIHEKDHKDCRLADIYRAATLGGAKFLGRDDIGRLAPGCKADIIIIDLDGYHIGPIDDPIRTMFLSGLPTDIKMSIINGKTVMKDRKIPGIDLEEIKVKGQQYYEKLKRSYMERDYQKLPEEEIFPPSFKTINRS